MAQVIDPIAGLVLDESESQVKPFQSTGMADDGDQFDEHFYGAFRSGMTRAEAADLLDDGEKDFTADEFLEAMREYAPDTAYGLHWSLSIHHDAGMADRVESEMLAVVYCGQGDKPETVRAASFRELADLLIERERRLKADGRARTAEAV